MSPKSRLRAAYVASALATTAIGLVVHFGGTRCLSSARLLYGSPEDRRVRIDRAMRRPRVVASFPIASAAERQDRGQTVLYVLENVPGTWHEGCLADER